MDSEAYRRPPEHTQYFPGMVNFSATDGARNLGLNDMRHSRDGVEQSISLIVLVNDQSTLEY